MSRRGGAARTESANARPALVLIGRILAALIVTVRASETYEMDVGPKMVTANHKTISTPLADTPSANLIFTAVCPCLPLSRDVHRFRLYVKLSSTYVPPKYATIDLADMGKDMGKKLGGRLNGAHAWTALGS